MLLQFSVGKERKKEGTAIKTLKKKKVNEETVNNWRKYSIDVEKKSYL